MSFDTYVERDERERAKRKYGPPSLTRPPLQEEVRQFGGGAAGAAGGAKRRAGAGAGGGTDPIGVAGLTLALIEGQGITVNTTPDPDQVSAWASQAPATLDYVQATSGNQPEYVSGAVKCQANDRQLAPDGWFIDSLIDVDGYTAYLLFELNDDAPTATGTTGAAILGDITYGTWSACSIYLDTGQNYAYSEHWDSAAKYTAGIAIAKSTLYLCRMRYSAADGKFYQRINGVENETAAGDFLAALIGSTAVYLFSGFGGNQPPVTLYRAYVFDAHLDSTTRDGIDDWFIANYPTVTL